MQIKVNGNVVVIEKPVSVKALLGIQKVEMPQYMTVEINDELIASEDFETVTVKENDNIEFLYFMGGGMR